MNTLTLLPPSKRPFFQAANEALHAGCSLYSNGRVLVSAPRKPGPGWHRVGVRIARSATPCAA